MIKDKSASVGKKRDQDIYFFCKPQQNVEINKFLFTVNSFVCETLSEGMNDNIRSLCAH